MAHVPQSPTPTSTPADSAMLGALIDTSGSVILGLRPDHTIFAWNRAAEELYQTPRARAIGMNYLETFLAPEYRVAVAEDIRRVLGGKRTLNFEDDSILPDGTRRTLLWNVSRVLDSAGVPLGIVATGQDITARKEAEERFRVIFEHASDGLLLSDASGVLDCNPAALAMLGLTDRTQLIGRRPAEFSPPLQPDGTPSDEKARDLGAVTLEQGAHIFDWVHQRPDGSQVPVEVSVRHAMLNGRRVSIVAWRDQSRRQEMDRERAVVEQRLSVARKMEAVGQLAGGVAHDFNNLLAAMRNAIELAMNEVPRELAIHGDLELALRTTERASTLTGQLLAFSRQQPRAVERIDLAQLVQDILPLLRTVLPDGVTLRVAVDTAQAPVTGDRSQLELVLLHLMLNARDAMPQGGELTVALRVDAGAAQVLLSVTDTGEGMDEATQARLFEPFFTTKPVGAGSGLGLAVVYGVVTQGRGTVRVESAPQQGTAVHIVLPLCVAEDPHPLPAAAPDPARRLRVLLVDDDSLVRSTTRRLLERSSFSVVDSDSATAALALFEAEPSRFDVLLSDIRMPEMGGVRLAQSVRAIAPDFPVVFISGYDAPEDHPIEQLASVHMVAKPFASDRLFAALRQAITERAADG